MARNGHTNKEIFTTIFKTNHWKSKESLSGPGSELRQTRAIRRAITEIFKKFNIRSMLDIPCGDFNWARTLDLSKLDQYIGADIVTELISLNRARYARGNIKFVELDITRDALFKVDLIFCKICTFK